MSSAASTPAVPSVNERYHPAMSQQHERSPNRLVHEKSPYLQQHAYNPVDWYPWGEEAFDRARRENKPIFLSIGYSTCHWCHVMERESFEDEETAAMMNELFVNIKVDREERPDVDSVYMAAAQAINGNGGWPLSAWLTPEREPFYVGTYFPPRSAYGRPGFRDALGSLHNAWANESEKVFRTATAIVQAIEKGAVIAADAGAHPPTEGSTDRIAALCLEQLTRSYDPRFGGFSAAPKFPRPAILEFLLCCHAFGVEGDALQMAHHTMRRMASGGMYDQLGGGFARYSVDAEWRVPHFEKMLYDQGQLLAAYADAYRLTGDAWLADILAHTIEYMERDLLHDGGLFYSAEDADSEGEEGTFYVWTRRELADVLTPRQAEAIEGFYGITSEGNFEHGKNVLHTSATHEQVAARMGVAPEEVRRLLAEARAALFTVRQRRVRPHRDEKILASWNGLAIGGLARSATATGRVEWLRMAVRAADALLETMVHDGVLMHRLKDGETRYAGYLDDYAFVAAGLIDLYEATFDVRYLREAVRLAREAMRLFQDTEGGGFFMSSGEDPNVLIRPKGDHDGAEPSGNSVMAMNLLRLGNLLHDEEFLWAARRTIDLFLGHVAQYPIMMPLMVAAAMVAERPPRQVVIAASEDAADTARLVAQAHAAYAPDTALLMVPHGGPDAWLAEHVVGIDGMGPVGGRAAAYVCENFVCRAPVVDLTEA